MLDTKPQSCAAVMAIFLTCFLATSFWVFINCIELAQQTEAQLRLENRFLLEEQLEMLLVSPSIGNSHTETLQRHMVD